MAINVFQHHDGIVHHQANRQHQRQQRERVDAEARQRHHGKGADQRHRNGDERNQRGAQRAQKNKNHQRHQHGGFDNGAEHGLDRLVDEHRVVVGHLDLHAGRQVAAQFGEQALHAFGQVKRVGRALLDHAHAHGIAAVQAHKRALVHRRLLHAGNVANANRLAIDSANHHLGKFLRPLQVGGSGHIELALLAFYAPGRHFQIGTAQGVFEVLHREPVGGQLVGIDPDAHREFAFAIDVHLSRARGGLQHRLDQRVGHL